MNRKCFILIDDTKPPPQQSSPRVVADFGQNFQNCHLDFDRVHFDFLGDSWFLDHVEVTRKGKTVFFPCQQWLSSSEGDRQVSKIKSTQLGLC